MDIELKWTKGVQTDALSVWKAKVYRLDGHGRSYGGGIRRDWKLYRGTKYLSSPSRLEEGKHEAFQDYRHLLIETLQAAQGGELIHRDDWFDYIVRPTAGVNFRVPGFISKELLAEDEPMLWKSTAGFQTIYGVTDAGTELLARLKAMAPGASGKKSDWKDMTPLPGVQGGR